MCLSTKERFEMRLEETSWRKVDEKWSLKSTFGQNEIWVSTKYIKIFNCPEKRIKFETCLWTIGGLRLYVCTYKTLINWAFWIPPLFCYQKSPTENVNFAKSDFLHPLFLLYLEIHLLYPLQLVHSVSLWLSEWPFFFLSLVGTIYQKLKITSQIQFSFKCNVNVLSRMS